MKNLTDILKSITNILPSRTIGVLGFIAVVFIIALNFIGDCFFIIQPNEMGAVRRLGQVTTATPLKPGWYFKVPIIDTADTLQVSLDTFKTEDLVVYTVDNQPVTISASMSYRIPERAVLKLLYETGQAGSVEISENIRPVLNDRIMRVFAKMNTTSLSEKRVTIAEEIKKSVQQILDELFGLEVVDLQISNIRYSKMFEDSIEAAAKAKNEALAAENTVKRIQYEGEQRVVTAKAEAEVASAKAEANKKVRILEAEADKNSKILAAEAEASSAEALVAKAEADKKAKILTAEGESRAIELEGEARAKALKMQADAIKDNPYLVEYTKAQRWGGDLPQTILGSTIPFIDVSNLMGDKAKPTP